MTEPENLHWQNLLALSAPTFAGDAEPPFGFTTRALARLRAEAQERELVERIGIRALFASLGLLVLATAAFLGVKHFNSSDLEPGLRTIVKVENIPFS